MKISVFNVKYSPNLGDGLLSECLEAELKAGRDDIRVRSIDLAGRADYGQGMANRRLALTVLEASPGPLRRAVVRTALGRTLAGALRPRWRRLMHSTDAVVVGGGNLFSDQDLNFPLKLFAALSEAAAAGLPTAVFGVGVADNWSQEGQALFAAGLSHCDLVDAAVRDERSQATWARRLPGVRPARLCRDPGLLTARHFPAAAREEGPEVVGLGVTDPLALRYHSADAPVGEAAMSAWFAALVEALADAGLKVRLFTNGSPEDRAYLARLAPSLMARRPEMVSVEPGFERPADLARFICGMDLVMAHRLHACIAAYAYRVPHIGFTWDPKLDAFFDSCGRGEFVARSAAAAPGDLARLARRALDEGIEAATHERLTGAAAADVGELRRRLIAATALP